MARSDRGTYVDRSKLSVGNWLDQWIEGRVNLRPASVVFYRVAIDRYLRPELGHLRLSDLRADDIDRAFTRIRRGLDGRGNSVSPALIGRLKTTLRAAHNVAAKLGLLHTNPALHVEVIAHVRPPMHVWDAATTGRFLNWTSDSAQGALWHLIALFGLRRGEAAGLRCSDVDLGQGIAVIAVQRTQIGRAVHEAAPKTKAGARSLSLDVGTVEALQADRAQQLASRLAWGGAWVDSGLVFTMEDGRGLQPQYLTRLFSNACADGGFPTTPLHDLRHTSASLGLAARETLVEVSKRLGHSQLAITADTYTHVLPVVALASSEARAALIPRTVTPICAHLVPTPAGEEDAVPTSCPPRGPEPLRRRRPRAVPRDQRPKTVAPPSGLEPETLRLTVGRWAVRRHAPESIPAGQRPCAADSEHRRTGLDDAWLQPRLPPDDPTPGTGSPPPMSLPVRPLAVSADNGC